MSLSIPIFTSYQEVRVSKLCRKKLWGSKNPENVLFKKVTLSKKRNKNVFLDLFRLQENSSSSLVLQFQLSKLKIAIENDLFGRKSVYF